MYKKIFLLVLLSFLAVPAMLLAAVRGEELIRKGIEEFRNENYEEAVEVLKAARQSQPGSSVAAFYLGLTYKQTGNYREAATHYKDAIRLVPPVQEAYTELIEVLYNLGELKEATEWIGKAEKDNVRPAQVSFLKGLVLAKEEDNREAIAAFEKAKAQDQSLAQAADLQIAMIYAKERRIDKARENLKAVIAVNPSSEIAAFARDYENAFAKILAEYKAWRFAVSAAYQFDDNVISKPLAFISPNFEESVKQGGGKSDSALVNTARIEYSPMLGGPWFLNAQYNLANVLYSTIDNLNTFSQSVSVTPGYNFAKGAVTLPLSYNYAWLHGIRYSWVASMRPALNYLLAPGHIGQVSAGYAKREMLRPTDPDEDRDADIYTLSAGYIYQFLEGRGMANLRYEYSKEDTQGDNWQNDGNRFGAAVLLPLVSKVNFLASGDVFLQQYREINTFSGGGLSGFPNAPTKRRDKTYAGSASVIWEALKGLTVNFQYSHTRADSNFAVYDYKRNQYTAGIEYSF